MSKQLTLDTQLWAVGESNQVSPTEKLDAIPHIDKYHVRGTSNLYYRLSWREGKRVKTIHIRGGNIRSELATKRASRIQAMIDRGAELWEIVAAVNTYR